MPRACLPVWSCAEAARKERAFLRGSETKSLALMQRAAEGIRDEVVAHLGTNLHRILVLAGKGNNGADAVLTAALLRRPRTEVTVLFAEGIPTSGQPAIIWSRYGAGMKVAGPKDLPRLSRGAFDLILDGLLGQGFRPPLRAPYARLIRLSAPLQGFRVAIDLPSGLGDEAAGPAVRADLTVSIGALKRPLLADGAELIRGRLRVIDIGLPGKCGAEACATGHALDALRRLRPARTEKRQQGRVLIVAGSRMMPGAAVMNTAAALQAGAGLVTTCLPEEMVARAAVAYPEAMWRGLPTEAEGTLSAPPSAATLANKDVLLTGSGMGAGASAYLRDLVTAFAGDCILDADALRPEVVAAARRKARTLVLLPHAGEFLRLSGKPLTAAHGRAYARRTRAIVVLKGPLSAVTDGRRLVHVPFGGPVLARGGSGDLLAGIVAAVLARRRTLGLSAFNAVLAAVTWHAQAADLLREQRGEEAIRTTELLPRLSQVWRAR
jgi:NAD(P)H-hydrate epimerase